MTGDARKISRRNQAFNISVLALTLILLALVIFSGNQNRYQDEIEYYTIAGNIVNGNGFSWTESQPTAYRPPVYPALLAALRYVSDSTMLPKFLNIIFIGASIIFFSRISKKISPGSEIYIPLLFMIYPVIPYSATTLYPQLLGMFLLAWILLIIFEQDDRLFASAKVGALLGVLILTIPGFLLCAPIIAAGFFCAVHKTFFWRAKACLLCLLVSMLVCSIWTARNYYHFHEIIPVSTNSGVNLLLGNSENATANSGVNADISRFQQNTILMNEVEKDAYYREQAILWITNNPDKAITLYIKKLVNYFNYELNLATKPQNSLYKDMAVFFSYYAIFGIAASVFFMNRKVSVFEKFLWIIYLGNAVMAAIFFTRIRFRIPFDGVLILLAAMALNEFIKQLNKEKNKYNEN